MEDQFNSVRDRFISRPFWHLLAIQGCIGLSVFGIERLFWSPIVEALSEINDDLSEWVQSIALLVMLALNVFYVLNSAVWSVFGDGKHSIRFSLPFVLYQVFLCSLIAVIAFREGALRLHHDHASVWAAATGIYVIHWGITVVMLSLLKSKGYRLRHFDRAAAMNTDQLDEEETSASESGFVLRSKPYSISDLLFLTGWIAFFLAAGNQVYRLLYVEVDTTNSGIFGRDFAFILVSIALGSFAVVSQFTIVPSVLLAMKTPRRKRKYLVLQSILLLHFLAWVFVLNQIDFLVDEGLVVAILGVFLFVAIQVLFTWLGRHGKTWQPFQLIK